MWTSYLKIQFFKVIRFQTEFVLMRFLVMNSLKWDQIQPLQTFNSVEFVKLNFFKRFVS